MAAGACAAAIPPAAPFGQFITVLPAMDLVVVHKTQAPGGGNVTPEDYLYKVMPAVTTLVEG